MVVVVAAQTEQSLACTSQSSCVLHVRLMPVGHRDSSSAGWC